MARKYLSKRTQTKHTYEFYKERRNSSQWRDDFLEVRSKRRIEIAIEIFVVLLVVVVGMLYSSKKGNPQEIAKQSESETSTTVSSSETESSLGDESVGSDSQGSSSTNNESSQVSSSASEENSQTSSSEISSDSDASGSQVSDPSKENSSSESDNKDNDKKVRFKEYIEDAVARIRQDINSFFDNF